MRKAMLLAAVFGLAGALWSADPSMGTWKLNIAKSKFPPTEQAPREQTLVKRELGADQMELAITGMNADGSPLSMKMTHLPQGGLVSGLPEGLMVILTVVAPGETLTTFIQNGKQAQMHHNTVSKDGKTMTQRIRYIGDTGQSVDYVEVWDRQ
jgi:hypothetical protein